MKEILIKYKKPSKSSSLPGATAWTHALVVIWTPSAADFVCNILNVVDLENKDVRPLQPDHCTGVTPWRGWAA